MATSEVKPTITGPKRVVGRRLNQIPVEILENSDLNALIASTLPANYDFEIHKTLHRID
jgi:2-(3-amino-3-carboxypropyl)histidine synthase